MFDVMRSCVMIVAVTAVGYMLGLGSTSFLRLSGGEKTVMIAACTILFQVLAFAWVWLTVHKRRPQLAAYTVLLVWLVQLLILTIMNGYSLPKTFFTLLVVSASALIGGVVTGVWAGRRRDSGGLRLNQSINRCPSCQVVLLRGGYNRSEILAIKENTGWIVGRFDNAAPKSDWDACLISEKAGSCPKCRQDLARVAQQESLV